MTQTGNRALPRALRDRERCYQTVFLGLVHRQE
jgi:hypothetical protein